MLNDAVLTATKCGVLGLLQISKLINVDRNSAYKFCKMTHFDILLITVEHVIFSTF